MQRSCKLDEELQEQLAGAATPPPAPETPPAILALPPIPGVLELPRPTESDLADLPCAVGMVHHQLSLWFSLSINEQVLRFFGEAGCWYEQFRHHPSFRAEASALRSLLEGERRLSALLTPIRQP